MILENSLLHTPDSRNVEIQAPNQRLLPLHIWWLLSLLRLVFVRWLRPSSLPLHFSKSLSFLRLILGANSRIIRNPACTPCDFHDNIWLPRLKTCALLVTEVLQPLTSLENSKTWPSLHKPCTTLCYIHTNLGIRTTLSVLISSEVKLKIMSTHSLRTFTALLAGIIRTRRNWNLYSPSHRLHTFNMKSHT
jgi:hypothetical protein